MCGKLRERVPSWRSGHGILAKFDVTDVRQQIIIGFQLESSSLGGERYYRTLPNYTL